MGIDEGMPRTAKPRAPIPDSTLPEPRRPIPVPHKSAAGQRDEAGERADSEEDRPVDPLAPGGSLFDEDDDAVEPNEPA
jgi:hypothetical protein